MSRSTTLQKKSRRAAATANKRAAGAVSPVAADARDAAVRYADATRDWAAPKVETAVDWAAPRVETAKEWAAPKVGSARDWAAPKVEPAVDRVRSDVLPAVSGAVATALAATEPARSEAAHRGAAALAALKGEVDPPKRSHKLRNIVVLLSVLAGAYAGWKAWAARSDDPVDAWTTPASNGNVTRTPRPVTPVPAMSAAAADVPVGTADPAGASPDEALADAATTPAEADLDAPTVTTEPVTAKQSEKVADAAGKGSVSKE